jgi:hypothetical protein
MDISRRNIVSIRNVVRRIGWRVTVYGHSPDRCEIAMLDSDLCRNWVEVCEMIKENLPLLAVVVIVPELWEDGKGEET